MFEKIITATFALVGAFAPSNIQRVDDVGGEAYVCKECIPRERIVAPGIGISLAPTYGSVLSQSSDNMIA